MAEEEKGELNRIEEMKKKVFSRSYKTEIKKREGFSISRKSVIPKNWNNFDLDIKEKSFNKTSVFKNFFILSIIVFAFSVGYLFYNFYVGGNSVSSDNVEISILGNTFTKGGDKLPLIIEILNKNNTDLLNTDLIVEYPKGSTLGGGGEVERKRISLGDVPANGNRNEKINVTLYGEQGSIHEIKISVEYRLLNSSAIFVKSKPYKITINSTSVDFIVEAPSEITPNQNLKIKVKTKLNDTKQIPNLIVKLDYPFGFEFISSTPSPTLSNNVWEVEDLKLGEEQEIIIIGKMVDSYDGEEKVFHIYGGTEKAGGKGEIGVVFNSFAHSLLIKKPFLETRLFVNGEYKKEYAVSPSDNLRGMIEWVNNLDIPLSDLEIVAEFSGNVFQSENVSFDEGFYDSLNNTITWDKNTEKNFNGIKPKESGRVNFSLESLSAFSSLSGSIIPDPYINVKVSIFAKQNVDGNLVKKLQNTENKTIKLISDISLAGRITHSSVPLGDIGPYPPKIEQKTTYTITWSIANIANNVSKVKVKSTLPSRIKFENKKYPDSEDLMYNSNTREIFWNVGGVQRGAGINSKKKEISFQVSLNPSLSEEGTNPILVNKAVLTGHDDFANVDLTLDATYLQLSERITR